MHDIQLLLFKLFVMLLWCPVFAKILSLILLTYYVTTTNNNKQKQDNNNNNNNNNNNVHLS